MRLIAPPAQASLQKSPAEIPAGSPADLPASPADLLASPADLLASPADLPAPAIADTTIN